MSLKVRITIASICKSSRRNPLLTSDSVDVKVICGEDVLTTELLKKVFGDFNTETLQVVSDASGAEHVILSKETEIGQDEFMDAKRQRVVTVDHVKQTIESSSGTLEATEHEETRSAVEKAMASYVESHYGQDTAHASVSAKDDKLVILVSAQKLNMPNFWGGRWMSWYTYDCQDKMMSGNVKIRIHYFEDGNVQMSTEKALESTTVDASTTSPEALAKEVVAKITEHESAIQASLEEMYLNMTNQTFKDMRRVLPISKQKMDWSGAQMALAQGFASKS